MAGLLFISETEVRGLLDPEALGSALSEVFVQLSTANASAPLRIAAIGPDGRLSVMPGYVNGILEAKLVSIFGGNEEKGLPSHQALIVLFDQTNGNPLAVMDATHITAARTAATSALATQLVAREDSRILAILGAGTQGRSHIASMRRVRQFAEIRVASRTRSHADELVANSPGTVVAASFEQAVRGADVICACTDSSEPVLAYSWLKLGAHVNSVGGSQNGPELGSDTIGRSRLIVESRTALQPFPAGAHELQGLPDDRVAELGEIIIGTRPGRQSIEEITVYKSTGHAVEDAAAAALIYRRALAEQVGQFVEM